MVALGLRLHPPTEVIGIVLRANAAVEFACRDEGGFIVGERRPGSEGAIALLDAALSDIRRDRVDEVPVLLRFEMGELSRILRSAAVLRSRVAMAEVVKGTVRRTGRLPPLHQP